MDCAIHANFLTEDKNTPKQIRKLPSLPRIASSPKPKGVPRWNTDSLNRPVRPANRRRAGTSPPAAV